MAKEYPRTLRVGELILRQLSEIIQDTLQDPRIGMVTLSDIKLSRDYAQAVVYFTVYGDKQSVTSSKAGLNQAAGFLRHELSHRLNLRITPKLRFKFDDTQEKSFRISNLLEESKHSH